MLQILQGYPLNELGFHSSGSVHYLTEAMRHAYHDRNLYLGDPAFIDNPVRLRREGDRGRYGLFPQ